jgi:Uma2 family endonuclease
MARTSTLVTDEEFRRIALEEPNRWELHNGELVRRPGMTQAHNDCSFNLAGLLRDQLDRKKFRIRQQSGQASRPTASYYIPDVMVLPVEQVAPFRGKDDVLETYGEPLPFVAEVWSRSTATYDVSSKLPEYRARGDLEVWLVHPFRRTVTAWRRQADGGYAETTYTEGVVAIESLPGVTISFEDLFEGVL